MNGSPTLVVLFGRDFITTLTTRKGPICMKVDCRVSFPACQILTLWVGRSGRTLTQSVRRRFVVSEK